MNKKIKPQDTQPIKPVIDVHDAFLNELDEMFNEIFDPDDQDKEDYRPAKLDQ